jgi:hypothetical protein
MARNFEELRTTSSETLVEAHAQIHKYTNTQQDTGTEMQVIVTVRWYCGALVEAVVHTMLVRQGLPGTLHKQSSSR